MKQIQLIGINPEEFKLEILDGIKTQLNDLKKNFQPIEPVEYLTRKDTALLLHVNLTTIWNWTKRGKLKAYGIGNRVYYKRSEIESALIKFEYS